MEYNQKYFSGKTAIVTGAASGIGLALAEELLQSGASKVVLADINATALQQHEKRLLETYPGKTKGILCDVTAEPQVENMIAEARDFFGGRIDLLFNNAGAGFSGWFDDMDNADWGAAFDLNFYSALYGMRTVLPTMKKQGSGQIINIISGIAIAPMAGQTRYSATKSALNGLSLAMRYEVWDDGIQISSATPGTTATNIFGPYDAPADAQPPRQSASRILRGAVNNDRIIYGSDGDAKFGADGADPSQETQKWADEYLLRVARERHEGKLAY